MNIQNYGYHPQNTFESNNGTPARITAVHHDLFEFVCDYGTGYAKLKAGEYYLKKETFPTTGDFVLLDWQESGDSRICKTLPRKTYFARRDPSSAGYEKQAVAANFDYVFIVQSLEGNFNPRRLERYLTLAWQSGAMPVVILTKADAVEDCAAYVRTAQTIAIGVDVVAVSAKEETGLECLENYLKPGKTIVFLGSSGVGKSTLINVLAGQEVMATGRVRKKDGRGRHTTSHRQLVLLQSGVMVIDTPGMREIGMWDAGEGLEQSFSDVEQFLGQCKFSDCRHESEPGCAVQRAIQQGELSPTRWESYQKLQIEARFANDKAGYLREKQQWHKSISKLVRATKETNYRVQPCTDSFYCKVCGTLITPEAAGSNHRNHCPKCLCSLHLDNQPGDRASLCKGIMDPIGVWVRQNGEWAIVHQCRSCGVVVSNRIAADDEMSLLMSIAMKPLNMPFQKTQTVTSTEPFQTNETSACRVCGTRIFQTQSREQGGHCPQCLCGIHAVQRSGAHLCHGIMEPVGIWIQKNGLWTIILRCRTCKTFEISPVSAGDNVSLLLSVAMKPLATPPFPLWQLGQTYEAM